MKEKILKIINLGKTETAKNTYLVFIGNALAAFLGMLVVVSISRKLGPEAFGIFSISFSLLSLMTNIGGLGINFAVVKEISHSRVKGETERIEKIFNTVFWFKLFFCIILSILGLHFNNFISTNIFRSPQSFYFNKLVFSFLFLSFFYDLIRGIFQAKKQFLESSLVYICANIIKIIFFILIVFFLPQFNNYILLYVFTPFLAALIFFRKLNIRLKVEFSLKEFRILAKFFSWMALSVIFAAIGENLNIFMISRNISAYQTGIYAAADKFTLPFSLFTGALGSVLISRTSEFLQLSHIKTFLKKIFVLQTVLLILFVIAVPFAGLIPFILGNQYVASVPVLQILIISCFFRIAVSPVNSLFYPLNTSIIFALDAILQVVLLLIFNGMFLPSLQAKGAAISLLLVNIIILIFNYLFLFFVLKKNENRLG